MSTPVNDRRRFLRTAGGLIIGGSAPLDWRKDHSAYRHWLWKQTPAEAAWLHLRDQLALALSDLPADGYLTLKHDGRYVQAVHEGRSGLLLEAGAVTGLWEEETEPLDSQTAQTVAASGWEYVSRHSVFRQTFEFPPRYDTAALALLHVVRECYHTPHPAVLTYYAATAFERTPILFPNLRLRRG